MAQTQFAALLLMLIVSPAAHAVGGFFHTNLFYSNASAKVATTSNETRNYMDFAVGFSVDKKGRFNVGWNYSIFATSTKDTSTSTYSATEMGPKFVYYFNRDRSWSSSLAYNLIVNATNKPGAGGEQKWRGSSFRLDVGYGLPIGESLRLGIHVVYHMTTFNEEVTTSTLQQISYNRTFIYPAIHFGWLF